MDLVPYIYWERQEAGSQLCAQHCLYARSLHTHEVAYGRNNLLQQHTYSEFDLADLARNLDQAENALRNPGTGKKSYNYDDTGFFSISVLERALQVWDLTLVRWRGEAMRPYQENPEDQAAFILHLSSHWFALRRFASKKKRWYNLNSFLPNGPEWISPTYLRLVLTQAEKEGYSVFVVRKAVSDHQAEGQGWGDGGVGKMLDSPADAMAAQMGEPMGRTGAGGFGQPDTPEPGPSANPDQPTVDPSPPVVSVWATDEPTDSAAQADAAPPRRRRRQEDLLPTDLLADDPFNQPFASGSRPPRPPKSTARTASGELQSAAQAEDVFAAGLDPTGLDADDDDNDIYQDADEEIPDDEVTAHGQRRFNEEAYTGPMDFAYHSRSYDDEDEALQAALKASMEDLPEGWVAPEIKDPPLPKRTAEKQAVSVSAVPAPAPTAPAQADKAELVEEDDDDDEPAETLTADEIRRRRLARFGGA